MRFSAIVVAGGTGSRAGAGPAKQWRSLAGRPVVRWSVEAFAAAGAAQTVVVVPAGEAVTAGEALAGLDVRIVVGGPTRLASVKAGLAGLADDDGAVLIHDAARPFLARPHVDALLDALQDADGALPALPVADTLKRAENGVTTVPRGGLWRAQTPQAFHLAALKRAFGAWPAGEEPTDDAQVVERAGGRIVLTPGDPRLMKLTYPEDFAMAEALAGQARLMRVGQGYDAHRFGPGQSIWLCGVEIPHEAGLVGHSDADVGLHALVDALLGAVGDGDIGDHFPPSDPKWKGAPSHLFLTHALERVRTRGGRVVNVDVTLICEAPRIKPHREAMRVRLADLLDLPLNRVSVKATTTEGMGYTGRREGLAAQAVAMVDVPA